MSEQVPREVWGWGREQVKKYPIYQAQLAEELRQAEAMYLTGGGDRSYDPAGVVNHGYAFSPLAAKLEAKEQYLNQPEILYIGKCVRCLEDARRGLSTLEEDILEAIWRQGWDDNQGIAIKSGTSPSTVKRAKREIVKRLAIRWGMWW